MQVNFNKYTINCIYNNITQREAYIGYVLDHEIGAAFLLHFSRGEMEFFLVPVTLKDGIHLSVSGFVYEKIIMI